jgi:hypothetical protein
MVADMSQPPKATADIPFHIPASICQCFWRGLCTDHNELRLWEVLLDHAANVLGVVQVQGGIDLIKDVQGGGLEPGNKGEKGRMGRGGKQIGAQCPPHSR